MLISVTLPDCNEWSKHEDEDEDEDEDDDVDGDRDGDDDDDDDGDGVMLIIGWEWECTWITASMTGSSRTEWVGGYNMPCVHLDKNVLIIWNISFIYIYICMQQIYTNRRKFRSNTSDNMDSWRSRGGKSQRGEDQREERRCNKMQVREKVGK